MDHDMTANTANLAQMASSSYELAALDREFLLGDSTRGVRFMLEYAKAEEMLRHWNIRSTIVVFGSARTHPDGPGKQPHWYAEARRFGRIASERGGALEGGLLGTGTGPRDNVIATGGGPSIGYNITLPHEQQPNAFSTPELTFRFHYFAMRKMHFVMRANALVVFPGGFGTLDELFELVTLTQTGKSSRMPILMFDSAYWKSVINLDALVEAGMVGEQDIELLDFVDDAEEAWQRLADQGIGASPT
jgi:uncharacterized protein (TIGR00730 family)